MRKRTIRQDDLEEGTIVRVALRDGPEFLATFHRWQGVMLYVTRRDGGARLAILASELELLVPAERGRRRADEA